MLILRRKVGECLQIGPDVELEVLEIGARGVKLGVRAPRAVRVMRKELLKAGEQSAPAEDEPDDLELLKKGPAQVSIWITNGLDEGQKL